MKSFIFTNLIFLIIFSFIVISPIVFAETNFDDIAGDTTGDKASETGPVSLDNPLGDVKSLPVLIGKIIKALLGITGSIALVMFIYGGFTWMTAAGSPEAVSKGKNILIWAVVGLVVIFSAYGLVNFVIGSLTATT